jgi:hypothetical protein
MSKKSKESEGVSIKDLFDKQFKKALKADPRLKAMWDGVRRRKGNCFAAALWVGMAAEAAGLKAVVVHGEPILQRPPFARYAHAWVEVALPISHYANGEVAYLDCAVDYSNGLRVVMPLSLYRMFGKIDTRLGLRYKPAKLEKITLKAGHYGPFYETDAEMN